jgi:hypothetical protein
MDANGNGTKARVEGLEKRFDEHLQYATDRFDQYAEFRGGSEARFMTLDKSMQDLHQKVSEVSNNVDRVGRRLAYFAGGLAVIVFLINLATPVLERWFSNI